jgi:hypothetical protein
MATENSLNELTKGYRRSVIVANVLANIGPLLIENTEVESKYIH